MTLPQTSEAPNDRAEVGTQFSRRRFLVVGGGSFTAAAALAACSSNPAQQTAPSGSVPTTNTANGTAVADTEDLSVRFRDFEVADEPNGDLTKVVWPSFVTDADPEVRRLYEFQITHGEVMRYMPCFCGCGSKDAGHQSNRDCYVSNVGADGSVELDSMAPT